MGFDPGSDPGLRCDRSIIYLSVQVLPELRAAAIVYVSKQFPGKPTDRVLVLESVVIAPPAVHDILLHACIKERSLRWRSLYIKGTCRTSCTSHPPVQQRDHQSWLHRCEGQTYSTASILGLSPERAPLLSIGHVWYCSSGPFIPYTGHGQEPQCVRLTAISM